MSGLKKTAKNIYSRAEKDFKDTVTFEDPFATIDPVGHVEDSFDDIETAFTPEIPEPEEETIIPIPDESKAALEARRRRAKSSRTGRDSTILTEGLGG